MSKYDFKKVKVKDIDGKVMPKVNVHKGLANSIYVATRNLDLVDIAMDINKGKAIELAPHQVDEIVRILRSSECPVAAFARKALLDYIEGVKNAKKETKRKS
jgi:hypothetical protein